MQEFKRTKEESLDYILVKTIKRGKNPDKVKAARLQLWNKYTLLTKKLKFKMIRIARDNGFHMGEWIEDYDSMAFERLMHVVGTVRLDDRDGPNNCKHLKSQWIIYQAYWGNLMSMNRDMIGDYIERNSSETAIYGVGRDGEESQVTNLDRDIAGRYHALEDEMLNSDDRRIFSDSWQLVENRMSKRQVKMVELLRDGKTRADVKRQLKMSQKGYEEEIESIKRTFSAIIQSLSKGRGNPMTYQEIVNKFS